MGIEKGLAIIALCPLHFKRFFQKKATSGQAFGIPSRQPRESFLSI